MVRINNLPFRWVCRNHGCDVIYTEEIIAKKLRYSVRKENKDLNTIDFVSKKDKILVLRVLKTEKPYLILQLGASNPDDAVKAVEIVKDDISGVDLNMGCPKHFSTHGNMGSALWNMPELAKEILQNLVKTYPDITVSCKIRWWDDEQKFEDWMKNIQESGIHYFNIHLRWKDQNCKFPAQWDKVEKVKSWAKIPFSINGDIFVPRDIQYLNKIKNVDAFMLGRGAIHNPKIFEEYKNVTEDLNVTSFNIEENTVKTKNTLSTKDGETFSGYSNNVVISRNLAFVLERKYNKKAIDIIPTIKELLELCLKYGNAFGNTKYVILYILKTHKQFLELFTKIQVSKTYTEWVECFNMGEDYNKYLNSNANMIRYYNNSIFD